VHLFDGRVGDGQGVSAWLAVLLFTLRAFCATPPTFCVGWGRAQHNIRSNTTQVSHWAANL